MTTTTRALTAAPSMLGGTIQMAANACLHELPARFVEPWTGEPGTAGRVAVVGAGKMGLPLAAQFASHGWHVTVLTNALLADAEKVLALETDMLLISVNGVSPQSYTAFHPNLDALDFRRLLKLLATFAKAGRRFKQVQVINRDTAPEVVEMVRFAANYNAAHITYKLASLGHGTETCAITETQRQQLLSELIPAAREEAARLNVATNLDVFQRQVAAGGLATAPIEEIGCFMGWYYARITVEGRILLCCSTEVEVGHLSRGPFSAQWYGAQWNEQRARLMRGEYFAGCAQCGKLNQNIKIGEKVREQLGAPVYLLRTGQLKEDSQRKDAKMQRRKDL